MAVTESVTETEENSHRFIENGVSSIEVLADYGFKFMPVGSNKKPIAKGSWESQFISTEATVECIKSRECVAAIFPSDVFALDIDKLQNGFDAWKKIKQEYSFPDQLDKKTLTVKTPSGGRHVYFSAEPEIIKTFPGYIIKNKIEILKLGGYAVAAGSPGGYVSNGMKPLSCPNTILNCILDDGGRSENQPDLI